MSEERAQGAGAAEPVSLDEVGSFIDEDLSDIPKKKTRHPAMMVAVILFSGLLMWMYWDDVAYFVRAREPQDLGETMAYRERYEADPNFDPGLVHNSFVRISGLTGLRINANDGEWSFFKLGYVPIYVSLGPEMSKRLSPDQVLYVTVSGRLRRMDQTSRYDNLQDYYRQRFKVSFANAYILEAGKKPGDFWWAPLLFALFVAFVGVNVFFLVRNLQKRR